MEPVRGHSSFFRWQWANRPDHLVALSKNERAAELPALYLSDYIIRHKTNYYINLRGVTEQQKWETWILFMLDMIEQTALKARHQIATIEELMNAMGREIQDALPKVYSKDLLEILFHLPYTKRSFWKTKAWAI